MRLVLFSLINVAVAALFGFIAYSQGESAAGIALRVVIVLVAMQLAYVVWLVAAAYFSNDAADTSTESRAQEPTKTPAAEAAGGTPEHNGGPVS